jgi:hypothetical protein
MQTHPLTAHQHDFANRRAKKADAAAASTPIGISYRR